MSEDSDEMYDPKFQWGKGGQRRRPSRRSPRRTSPRLGSLTQTKVSVGALVDGLRKSGHAAELRQALAESVADSSRKP